MNTLLIQLLQYIGIAMLTFFMSSYIIKRNTKIRAKGIKTAMKSQSIIYNKTKQFIPKDLKNRGHISQSINHSNKFMVKVMVIDDNAYWVKDNIFFTADVKDGSVMPETARQVDTLDMSKKDIDKMIFILDKLKDDSE